jgi:putative transport protein
MGLVFGWLRSVYPTFGRIPSRRLGLRHHRSRGIHRHRWLTAAPSFVDGLRRTGVSLVMVGRRGRHFHT